MSLISARRTRRFAKKIPKHAAAALAMATAFASPAAFARDPKPLEPAHALKPAEGYFDEAFAIEPGGEHLYLVRTDGATFAKLEVVDLATGKTTSSFDLPKTMPAIERMEPLGGGKGVVLIGRAGTPEAPVVTATLVDGAGKVGSTVGPAHAFGRPSAAPQDTLIAFDRKLGPREGDVTYALTPYHLSTLTPAGKLRSYKTVGGELKSPPFRILDFEDGYARAIGEVPRVYVKKDDVREPPRMATLDTLTGKVGDESPITDVLAWAQAATLRARHPGRSTFVELNKDDAGVDVVDAMGNRHPVDLAVPFQVYDPKSLVDQEGPEPGAFYFGISVDPVNVDAVKRRKADLPMLDIYAARGPTQSPTARARVFIPRKVSWRAGYGKLVVLKRFKSFTRGGDELDVYQLR
ncbi:MAG TPA: hypothetical protein VH560_05725 [Polyangia bacterium]|jgi:hypothetical protein|nr:hypothetical protein [Polyangia bacterium]